MRELKAVCLFCGSRTGVRHEFQAASYGFGVRMAQENWRLVYGAGDVGLMGIAANAAKAAGGRVVGVIPQHLVDLEIVNQGIELVIATETMHERKKVMFMNSDAIVALPGGAGTLDELFEAITWRQLGIHDKPIFLLNVSGYWDAVPKLIDHVIDSGFADADLRDHFRMTESLDELFEELRSELG